MVPSWLGMMSWGSAGMLAWGAVIAIPVVIHFWTRRRHQDLPWAATQFLVAAMKKHSRRLRIEQLVLLAIRMLLLASLAAALADPVWSGSVHSTLFRRADATHYLFIVDTSFSMGFRDRSQTRLQAAQNQIRELIESSHEGDGFSLIQLQRPPVSPLAEVAFDRSEVLRQVEKLQLTHHTADLAGTLSLAEQAVRQAERRFPRLVHRRICWFSDLGLNTWSEVTVPAGRDSLDRLGSATPCEVYDVGIDEASNLAVTKLVPTRELIVVGETVQFTAEIQAFGQQAFEQARLEFLVNGRVVHSESVKLPPAGRQIVSWDWVSQSVGDQAISARITTDSLPLDNERWQIIRVRESHSVLCVAGEAGAAEFVALALNPDARIDTPIRVTECGENGLLDRDLSGFDAVFLCNVGQVTSHEASVLRQYVERGGGLIVSLGDQVHADNYNRELRGLGVLPAELLGIEQGEFQFDPLEYRHAMITPFRGRERAGLLTVPTWRYFRLGPVDPSTIPLAFSSPGHPAVVEHRVGRGRCVLVATALSTSSLDSARTPAIPWTALPAWPSFPPLVHGLFRTATEGLEIGRTATVGSALIVPLAPDQREVNVTRPDQRTSNVQRDTPVESNQIRLEQTDLVGVYAVAISGPEAETRLFAINLDNSESDLRRLSRSSWPPSLQDQLGRERQAESAARGRQQFSLFRPLLAAVAVLLLVEQLMATFFAKRSQ